MSDGSTRILASSLRALAAVASTSATSTFDVQCAGVPAFFMRSGSADTPPSAPSPPIHIV